jgi:hypothetical protein
MKPATLSRAFLEAFFEGCLARYFLTKIAKLVRMYGISLCTAQTLERTRQLSA